MLQLLYQNSHIDRANRRCTNSNIHIPHQIRQSCISTQARNTRGGCLPATLCHIPCMCIHRHSTRSVSMGSIRCTQTSQEGTNPFPVRYFTRHMKEFLRPCKVRIRRSHLARHFNRFLGRCTPCADHLNIKRRKCVWKTTGEQHQMLQQVNKVSFDLPRPPASKLLLLTLVTVKLSGAQAQPPRHKLLLPSEGHPENRDNLVTHSGLVTCLLEQTYWISKIISQEMLQKTLSQCF